MAQWKGIGAFVKELAANRGEQAHSDNASSPSQPSQFATRRHPAYLQDWTKPPNTGAMAPVHPANGPVPGGFTPSPLESVHPVALRSSQEPQTMSPPATNSATSNSKDSPIGSVRSDDDGSQSHVPEDTTRRLRTTPRKSRKSGPFPHRAPVANSISTPHSAPVDTPIKRRKKYSLKSVAYLDGEISVFPPQLRQQIREFARANGIKVLPFARSFWTARASTAETFADGCPRKWLTYPGRENLSIGRFRYGWTNQILSARGLPGSQWENGQVVIIGAGGTNHGGSSKWKVWHSQQFDEEATILCERNPPATIEGGEQSMAEAPQTKVTGEDENATMVQTPGVLPADASREAMDVEAGPSSFKFNEGSQKRGHESFNSVDSDVPIAAEKRMRLEAANAGFVPTDDGAARLSPELGSSPVVQASASNSPRAPPTISPLNSSLQADLNGQTLKATPSRDTALSPRSSRRVVIEIKDEDDSPGPNTVFNIENVRMLFIDSKSSQVGERAFKSCDSIVRLFRAADGANIINSDIDKLTITIVGKTKQGDINVVREFEEDFDQLKVYINKLQAGKVKVVRGTKMVA